MYKQVQCFGGPMHGKSMSIDNGVGRFEVATHLGLKHLANVYTQEAFVAKYVAPKMYTTHTYYLYQQTQHGVTEANAQVSRRNTVALLEGTDLFLREQADLDRAIRLQRWEWLSEPNFLTQFDQWWEYQLAVVGHKQPNIRHYA